MAKMFVRLEKSELSGTIECPPNKSYTHRAIFAGLLSNGENKISNPLLSNDINSTVKACRELGAGIRFENEELIVYGNVPLSPGSGTIDAGNSGTTIRISAALAALTDKSITLTGDQSLRRRPMMPIVNTLESLRVGCRASEGGVAPITVNGRMSGGRVKIDGSVSSQFISGIMLAAPLTEKGVELEILKNLVSSPYVDQTIAVMEKHKIKVETIERYKKYSIPSQNYRPADFSVPSDFSSAALLLAGATLVGSELKISMKGQEMPQGDKAIIGILEQLGVRVRSSGYEVQVSSPQYLDGGSFDLNKTPDLLPAVAILALKSRRPIEITNVKHAKDKESDRIKFLCSELRKTGIDVQEREDGMILERNGDLKGAQMDSDNDHRLFMAFTFAGMYLGNSTVSDPDSADISFPGFVEQMKRLHAKIGIRS